MSQRIDITRRESRFSIQSSEADKALLAQAARAVITDQSQFRLSPEQWKAFCRRLDAPAKTMPALHRLFSEADLSNA